MAKERDVLTNDALGTRLSEVAEILDRAVEVLAQTLAEIRKKEYEGDYRTWTGGTDALQDHGDGE